MKDAFGNDFWVGDDEESEEGLGVHYYPDCEYNDEVTVEIADALRELVELKAKY